MERWFPLSTDYQLWEPPSNISDSADWQVVGGDEVWGYMPCNELSIWEEYHDDLERAKLKEEMCKGEVTAGSRYSKSGRISAERKRDSQYKPE